MSLMKIKDLFHFEKGSLQSTKATPGDYNFITAAADWKTHNEFTHDCEALIFAAAASGSLGRTHYVNGKFISSDLCFIITPKDPDKYPIDLKFYYLIFQAFKEEIVRNTKSGTSKESIGLTVFGKYELPYFEITKQVETREKFVNAQESAHKLNSELELQLVLLTQLRQAFLKEAMQGELVPQDSSDEPASELLEKIIAEKDRLVKEKKIKKQKPLPSITEEEIPFDIPENWTWCRLGEICLVKVGSTPSRQVPEYWRGGTIPWVSSGEVANNLISSTKESITQRGYDSTSLIIYPKDSVLVAMIGQGKTRGQTAILKIDATTNQNVAGLIKYSEELLSKMIWYFFLSRYEVTRSGASGGNQPALNGIKISRTVFALPPFSEQVRIVAKLDELTRLIDELESKINDSILQGELLLKQVLAEDLDLKLQKAEPHKKTSKKEERTSKFDPNTTLMEIVELLKKHGKLHAEELWKMSKYPDDIDAFYAELKKQIELNQVVKESEEKGYLELA